MLDMQEGSPDRQALQDAIGHIQKMSINQVAIAVPYFRIVPTYPRPNETNKRVKVMINVSHWIEGDWGIGGPVGLMRVLDRQLQAAGFEPKGGSAPAGPAERTIQRYTRRNGGRPSANEE